MPTGLRHRQTAGVMPDSGPPRSHSYCADPGLIDVIRAISRNLKSRSGSTKSLDSNARRVLPKRVLASLSMRTNMQYVRPNIKYECTRTRIALATLLRTSIR